MASPRTSPLQKKAGGKVDLEKQRGLYDTPDLREKVLKWQTPPKISSPVEVKAKAQEKPVEEAMQSTTEQKQEVKKLEDKGVEGKMDGEKTVALISQGIAEDEATLEQDLRAASSPKKRVVSDEHWKKGRSPTANKSSPTPKPTVPAKSLEHGFYIRPGSNKYDAWVRRKSMPAKPTTLQTKIATPTSHRKASQPKVLAVTMKTPERQTGNVEKLTIPGPSPTAKKTTPTKENKTEQERVVSSTETIVIIEKRSKSASPKLSKVPHENRKLQAPSPVQLDFKTSAPAKPLESHSKPPAKSPELRSKPVAPKPKTIPAEAPKDDEEREERTAHLGETRIDAWLTNTPDPFIDDDGSDWSDAEVSSPIEVANTAHIVKPLSIRVHKVETRRNEDEHDDRHELPRRRGTTFGERKRSTRIRPEVRRYQPDLQKEADSLLGKHNPSEAEQHSDDNSSEISSPTTPTLKRSKATRKSISPRKAARARADSIMESVTSNSLYDAPTTIGTSTIDFQPRSTNNESGNHWYRDKVKDHGNRLTTIASVETISTLMQDHASSLQDSRSIVDVQLRSHSPLRSTIAEHSDAESEKRPRMARKMTSHADLISVLSMADEEVDNAKTAHGIRSCRSKLGPANLTELMDDLKKDETKYLRELRTMVDGVVPVLLHCVVSKSSSAIAAGLFNSLNDSNATTVIMNIGVALERLKCAHQRMPTSSPEALLTWAQGSHRIYADYLTAWRMGFQDIVVNLAPADNVGAINKNASISSKAALPRDGDGYVVKDNGGKVDVAYLLKRPLVRLKYLARTLKNINDITFSDQASLWSSRYQELVEEARRRQDGERGRLEDQAAASIDATRAREPQTLAPLAGVRINPRRCVRARDFFTLKFQHSSGQRVDCGVELLLRDNTPELGDGGDVLICEVDSTSKWLLFPPVQTSQISARLGDQEDEVVVMIRGQNANGLEWHELLSLKAGNPLVSHEWGELLGTKPVPPSFPLAKQSAAVRSGASQSQVIGALVLASPGGARTPSQMVIDVPIGEKVEQGAKQWRSQSAMLSPSKEPTPVRQSPEYFEDTYIPEKMTPRQGSPTASQVSHSWRQNFSPSPTPDLSRGNLPTGPRNMLHPSRSPLPTPPLIPPQQSNATTNQQHREAPTERRGAPSVRSAGSRSSSYTVWHPQQDGMNDSDDDSDYHSKAVSPKRPGMDRRISNTPDDGMPHIPRVRMMSPSRTPGSGNHASSDQSYWNKQNDTQSGLPRSNNFGSPSPRSPRSPVHSPPLIKSGSKATSTHATPGSSTQRRSSSPLKREYLPSSDSDSSSAMGDIQSDDDESITSDSSADDMYTHSQMPAGLFKPRVPSGSVYSPKVPGTLTPSQSASQGPYRTVPPQEKLALKMIASLFCWSEKGVWESIHPDECSVVVSPGLIEAFEMSAAHSSPNNVAIQRTDGALPLVALELTPLVPLRRGTALDISIRSPPTANSRFRAGTNIMFRSRTGQECEILYGHINQARINNPTYIALQNARGPFGGGTWASYMDHRASLRNHSAWWRFGSKKSSYRKTATRHSTSSSIGQTDSSVGTISAGAGAASPGAMSAFRRISAGSKVFSVAKSTVTSRGRVSGSSTTFTSSSGSGSSTTPGGGVDPAVRPTAGLTNSLRIRLYLRETASKWRDLGAARLTIMHPPATGTMMQLGAQKRILVTGKTRGETLVDVVLGENAFERVARTGIAVNVWEETKGPNGEVGVVAKTGGVVGGRGRVFMIQLKSEAETAYAFSLVGRLRY